MEANTEGRLEEVVAEVDRLLQRHRLLEAVARRQDTPRSALLEEMQHRQNLVELQRRLTTLHPADLGHILESLPSATGSSSGANWVESGRPGAHRSQLGVRVVADRAHLARRSSACSGSWMPTTFVPLGVGAADVVDEVSGLLTRDRSRQSRRGHDESSAAPDDAGCPGCGLSDGGGRGAFLRRAGCRRKRTMRVVRETTVGRSASAR